MISCAPCPVCHLPDGFHDERIHAEVITIPAHLLIRVDPVARCNCGAPVAGPGTSTCRNPRHTEVAS